MHKLALAAAIIVAGTLASNILTSSPAAAGGCCSPYVGGNSTCVFCPGVSNGGVQHQGPNAIVGRVLGFLMPHRGGGYAGPQRGFGTAGSAQQSQSRMQMHTWSRTTTIATCTRFVIHTHWVNGVAAYTEQAQVPCD